MLENIPPLATLTVPGLLGLTIFLILIGKLVPKATYDEKAKEADRWREAYETEREARVVSDAQTAELLELAKTTKAFIVGVFDNSQKARRSGEVDAATKE